MANSHGYTDKFFKEESQFHHPEGSLEAIAQNLVRTFEMEASHKANPPTMDIHCHR